MSKKAKFSNKVKQSIMIRDYHKCILCYETPHSIHHAYFWLQANRWDNRNDEDQWVALCFRCHNSVHWCKSWEWDREECINYLKHIYE